MPARFSRFGGLLLLGAVIALVPLAFTNSYYYDIAVNAMLNAIVCVGLNLLIGYAGQISLGHAGFLALGAYGSTVLTGNYGLPPVAALLLATLGVALLAYLVGKPILKLKGHYLAMATLGFGIIIHIVLKTEAWLTGGPDGISVPGFSFLGFSIVGDRAWYWAVGLLLLLGVWLAQNLIESPVGRALRALHNAEVGAEVVGVNTAGYKLMIFVVSAVFASVAGSVYAHKSGFITPEIGGFFHSIELVTMVVLGGMASIYGAILGAILLTLLPQVLTSFEQYEAMILGAIMMGMMIFLPKGLLPSLIRMARRRRSAP